MTIECKPNQLDISYTTMHYSEVLLELTHIFANQYITPAGVKAELESFGDYPPIPLQEIIHQFQYLTLHHIIDGIDGSAFNPTDRFELSYYWCTLSEEEKDSWYVTIIGGSPTLDRISTNRN